MTTYEINTPGVRKAKAMIAAHQYDIDADWTRGAPTTQEANDEIERHGFAGYGEWHLAIDTGASDDTKDRYGFPYGDFRRVYRSALIHAKQRAVQNGHDQVADAADELLTLLDRSRAS